MTNKDLQNQLPQSKLNKSPTPDETREAYDAVPVKRRTPKLRENWNACPYCELDVSFNYDDGYSYSEDQTYQHECEHCDKTFSYTTHISYDHPTKTAPCLNGGEHADKPVWHVPFRYPDWVRCIYCDREIRGERGE